MNLSTVILTYNEEMNIDRCLNSLSWCSDIVVLDSHSTDDTTCIAERHNARIFYRVFDNYANQRNYAINEINYKNNWLLMIDADEIVPPELHSEIQTLLESDTYDICLYKMRRKDFFMNKWIKRSSGYPTWFGRLIKIGHVYVTRSINEEYNTDGSTGYLKCHLHHYPFNKGIDEWVSKHNRYSRMEAELLTSTLGNRIHIKNISFRDPSDRRRLFKQILYLLPFRPVIVFIYLFFLRGGFLDGRPGFMYCTLRSYYEFLINVKIKEIRQTTTL